NGNYSLDSEGLYDSWYGNGRLDTEDVNGNGKLDPGEDLNGNGRLDTEDVDRDGKLTTYRMFDRQPQWQTKSDLLSLEWRHTLSPRTYYTVRLSRYHTEQTSNVIERLNEDTDLDGVLDVYWATEPFEDLNGNNAWDEGEWYADLDKNGVYDYDLNWDVDGDGDNRNEDLNGNGLLDAYTPEKEVTTIDDDQDMFHDWNNNRYVDESERDWDGDGDIDEYDKRYFWIPWIEIKDEGFQHTTGGFYGVGSGHPYTFNRTHWHKDFKDVYMAQFDLLSQITDHHKFNTGFELSYYDMFNYSPPDRYSYAEKYHVNPIEWAAYLTDKMEYAGLVVNAGLRVQYFDPRQQYPAPEPYVDENRNGEYDYGESFTDVDGDAKWDDGETDPTWSGEDYADWDGDGAPEYYKVREALAGNYIHEIDDHKNPKWAKVRWNLMPRLGVSHAITDKAMLYFNYGRYFQRPAMAYIFRNINYDMGGGYPIVGNPNLAPELTTQYEVGVRYEFLPGFLVEGKGFYKDIFGLTDTRPVFWTVSDWYTTYFNRDFGNVRGFELTLLRRPPGLITGEVNYTYSISKGKASSIRQGYLTEWSGNIVPTFESYLQWDQTHMLVAHVNLIYHNFLTSLIFNYGSGTRYTRPGQGKLIVENTERYPSRLSSSLRMSYGFSIGKMRASMFFLVNNLFNKRDVRRLPDVQWYHTYKTLAEDYESGKITYNEYMTQVDLNHDGKIDQNKNYPERGAYLNPVVYSDIRRVQIGLSFRLN
ncbi:MAG: TonB-dependent receptor, partial [Dehalococcoidia bacterium]|nr:TonB-dependent receptor [Dehalococcoidia bacterium]